MALIATNNAEGGVHGNVPTITDGGSGTNWTQVTSDTDKIKYSNVRAAHGSLSYEFLQGSVAIALRWDSVVTGIPTSIYGRLNFYPTGNPAASNKITRATDTAGQQAWAVNFSSTARIIIKNNGDGTVWTSTTQVPHNQWMRLEWFVVQAGASGTLRVRIFLGKDYVTPTEDSGPITGNYSTESNTVTFGPVNSSPAMPLCYIDDMAIADSAHGWIGPAGAPVTNPQSGWGMAAR